MKTVNGIRRQQQFRMWVGKALATSLLLTLNPISTFLPPVSAAVSSYLPDGGSRVTNLTYSTASLTTAGYIKIDNLFYKLNNNTHEAIVVGYDRTNLGLVNSSLVIPREITPTLAQVGSANPLFETTYTVSYIGNNAFFVNSSGSDTSTFSSIVMPNSIKVIGSQAFFGICTIREIVIPDSVTDIGGDAFSRMSTDWSAGTDCTSGITSRGFSRPNGIETLTVGSSLERFLGGGQFAYNPQLKSINFKGSSSNFETPTAVTYPPSYDAWQWGGITAEGVDNGSPYKFSYMGAVTLGAIASKSAGWLHWATPTADGGLCSSGLCMAKANLKVVNRTYEPGRPNAPSLSSATLTGVTVVFSEPSSDGGSPITSYTIQFSSDNWSTWETATSTLTTAINPFNTTGLLPSTSYRFRVIATNNVGFSAPSQSSALITTLAPTRPNAPTIGVATLVDSRTASITFTAPADNGGSAITSFTVTSYPSRRSGTGSASPIQVTGLTLNSPETFTVTATNSVGTSDSSTASNVVTPKEVYVVTFDSQGGNSVSSGSFFSGESVTAPASSPAKSGYTFNGWFVASSGGTQVAFPYAPGVTNNITLFAQWRLVPVASTTPAPVVLGPPPSTFVVVSNPKISRSGTSLVCTSGTYKFKKQGGKEEASSITSQLISLLSNGAVVDSEKTLESQSTFEGKPSYKGTTLSCEVGIKQEEVVKPYSSLDPAGIASYEAAMTAAIYGANTTYYSERDAAYLKRDAGDTKVWKEMLDKALLKREDTKVQAGVDYLANLEKAGISILIALDKAAPAPTPVPAPTPTPTKSPEVSVTGNVQPAAMKKVGTIYFASGTYFLNDESKKTIKALATSIFMKSPATVLSYGFTDSKGGTDNTVLSQNRAKAVAKLLRSLLPGQKIATGWYASNKPVATGNSKAALAKNRRVEIYIK